MKSQSLNFFPRESKLSTAEEHFMSDFNVVNREKVANQRLESFAVYMLLLMQISNSDDYGYFIEYNQDNKNLLAQKIGTDNKFLHRVVLRCLERGLFDKEMYQKYGILTSIDIQDKYFRGKTRVTSQPQAVLEYLFAFIYQKHKNVLKKFIIVNKNGGIVYKPTEKRRDDNETETDTEIEIATSKVADFSLIEKFKQAFPEKTVPENYTLPNYVDIDALIEAINQSPQFLKICNNLDLKWLCEPQDRYDKVIRGDYKKFTPQQAPTHENRSYSQEELQNFYTNIEDIEI